MNSENVHQRVEIEYDKNVIDDSLNADDLLVADEDPGYNGHNLSVNLEYGGRPFMDGHRSEVDLNSDGGLGWRESKEDPPLVLVFGGQMDYYAVPKSFVTILGYMWSLQPCPHKHDFDACIQSELPKFPRWLVLLLAFVIVHFFTRIVPTLNKVL